MSPAALLYLVPVVLLWASTPLLVVELSRGLPAPQINFLTGACAVAALALIVTATGRWPVLRRHSARDFGRMALLGLVGIFPYTALYYLAISLAPTAAGEVNIVNYLWPIWIVILSSLLLGEPLTGRKILGVALSFAGVCLVVSGGRLLHFRAENLPAYLAAALPGFALLALLVGPPLHPPAGREILLLLFLGGVVNGVGYLCWILALRAGDTARLSSAVYLVPFIALLYLVLFGRAALRAYQLVALLLVVAGPCVIPRPRGRRLPAGQHG